MGDDNFLRTRRAVDLGAGAGTVHREFLTAFRAVEDDVHKPQVGFNGEPSLSPDSNADQKKI